MAFLKSTETKEQAPLQLAIYVVQNRHAASKSRTGTSQTEEITIWN